MRSALALTLSILAAAPAAAAPFGLEKAGWTLVTASDDTWVYMRHHAHGDDGVRKAWTAYDSDKSLQRDGFAFRSVESLGEFDCRKGLSRVVDEIYHDKPNLAGRAWRSPKFMVTPWAAPAPESVGAVRMAFACRAITQT
ncbi:surface-adhesin E family protein [Phenylobacterium sp.]|uniref:surface-adhesin E family protein n=1 Tax=Phenylobacterium sp. TaxID=1871053 RepID=UPI0025E65AD7|nr:surface-adhesin E family protein [Phenylobacterium sp.]